MMPKKTRVRVPNERKQSTLREALRRGEEHENFNCGCLFVAGPDGLRCGKRTDSVCHTIPHAQVLGPLSDLKSGKVREVMWGVGTWADAFIKGTEEHPVDLSDPSLYEPRWVGIGEASGNHSACPEHDNVFGSTIDVAEPDFTDSYVAFMFTYRAYLNAVFQLKRVNWLRGKIDQPIMRGNNKRQRNEWLRKMKMLDKLLPFLEDKELRLGQIWHDEGKSANIKSQIITGEQYYFRSELTFAACALYGMASVAAVFPAGGDWHKLCLAHFMEITADDAQYTDKLTEIARNSRQRSDYGVSVLAVLGDLMAGTIDMSPDSYEGLAHEERRTINKIVEQAAQADFMSSVINEEIDRKYGRR